MIVHRPLLRLSIIAMLLAVAIVLSYLESFIPIWIPGVKLGLANVIILIMLYEFKFYEAGIVDILRILVVALIRGTFMSPTFFMSLSGGILSYFVMLPFILLLSLGTGILSGFIARSYLKRSITKRYLSEENGQILDE